MHIVNVQADELFQALADPYRIRMVRLMLSVKSEICLCELSDCLLEPEYKLSRHLKILKQAGLINSVRDGKWIYHSLVQDQKYLTAILQTVALLPDNGEFKIDLDRFKKRLKLREKGRCTMGTRFKPQRQSEVRHQ